MGTPKKKKKKKGKKEGSASSAAAPTKVGKQVKQPRGEKEESGREKAKPKPEHDDWIVDEREIVRKTARPRSARASMKGPNARKASTKRK